MGTFDFAMKRILGAGENEAAELAVVAVVGPGVVLLHVNGSIANTADRSPAQVAKMDNEVRCDVLDRSINLLGFVDLGAERAALLISRRLEHGLDLVAEP